MKYPGGLINRPHGGGYPTESLARRAAQKTLGPKAKRGLMFVLFEEPGGSWGWINASWCEINKPTSPEAHR